jgi:hypothetical protein
MMSSNNHLGIETIPNASVPRSDALTAALPVLDLQEVLQPHHRHTAFLSQIIPSGRVILYRAPLKPRSS